MYQSGTRSRTMGIYGSRPVNDGWHIMMMIAKQIVIFLMFAYAPIFFLKLELSLKLRWLRRIITKQNKLHESFWRYCARTKMILQSRTSLFSFHLKKNTHKILEKKWLLHWSTLQMIHTPTTVDEILSGPIWNHNKCTDLVVRSGSVWDLLWVKCNPI